MCIWSTAAETRSHLPSGPTHLLMNLEVRKMRRCVEAIGHRLKSAKYQLEEALGAVSSTRDTRERSQNACASKQRRQPRWLTHRRDPERSFYALSFVKGTSNEDTEGRQRAPTNHFSTSNKRAPDVSSRTVEWDEDTGGPRDPNNFIQFPNDCNFVKSTGHSASNRSPWADTRKAGASFQAPQSGTA